jgi:diguanylate cyclase (GGDEF)-like protein
VLGADLGQLFMLTDAGDLRLEAGHGLHEGMVGSVRVPAGSGSMAGAAIVNATPIVVTATDAEAMLSDPVVDHGAVGGFGVAIRVLGQAVGSLCLFDTEPRDRGDDDINVLHSIANLLANAIHRMEAVRELDRRAVTDELTGLPNRALFLDRLGHALDRHDPREGGPVLAVLFADLDEFKSVNDTLGHAAGDELLDEVARRIVAAVPGEDTVARFGGDEFAVLCESIDSAELALTTADRLERAISERPIRIDGHELTVSASIGIALSGDRSATPETLLRDADAAMYRAKAAGGGRSDLFHADLRDVLMSRLELTQELRTGIDRKQFELFFQPEVALDGSGEIWAEALVRWHHPTRGLLAPEAFIRLAEETGLIIPLGNWILEAATALLARWNAELEPPTLSVSVNLSARQLLDEMLVERIAKLIRSHRLRPGQLWFELTETSLLQEPDRSLDVLTELRGLGVGLAIDDFGTGYASLAYAQQLPVDALKIDRSFVAGFTDDPRDAGIVRAIIEMARSFGVLTIAEGVESRAQLDELTRLGCDFAQGYLLSPALPPDDLIPWVRAWRAEHGSDGQAEQTGP